ncbi:hypothetical protein KAU11_01540, partial [Candidatus Babeliales bacterium]|nr:hypothetical protein [Candidatus Babeliales bacterium]
MKNFKAFTPALQKIFFLLFCVSTAYPKNISKKMCAALNIQFTQAELGEKIKNILSSKQNDLKFLKQYPKEILDEKLQKKTKELEKLFKTIEKNEERRKRSLTESRLTLATYSDLRLLFGDPKTPFESIANIINKNKTQSGSAFAKALIARPTTSIERLKLRQGFIKIISENSNKRNKAITILARLAKLEPMLLKFFLPGITEGNTPLSQTGMRHYWDRGFWSMFIPQSLGKQMNRSTTTLQTTQILKTTLLALFIPTVGSWLIDFISTNVAKAKKLQHEYMEDIRTSPFKPMEDYEVPSPITSICKASKWGWNKIKSLNFSTKGNAAFSIVVGTLSAGGLGLAFGALPSWNLMSLKKTTSNAQSHLIAIKCLLGELYDLVEELGPEAVNNLELGKDLKDFFAGKDKEIAEVLEDLDTTTFEKGKPSLLANQGRILKTYRMLYEIRDKFAVVFEGIGEIDALCSAATLCTKHTDKKNGFCFAQFEQAQKPHLKIDGMWDLFIDPEKAVANDIELGGNKKNHRYRVLSGPNAGGKSVYLGGTITAVILAQSLGIVPAKSATLTPFSNFDTYMNIEDSPGEGKSLFQKQIQRISEVMTGLKEVKNNDFSLVIADEMFTGTNPDAATKMSIKIMEQLKKHKNTLGLICTHFHDA